MAILTNITEEHLDYHKTMDDYAMTKKQLFLEIINNSKPNKLAIFPKDDKYGKKRSEELYFDKMMTYGIISSGSVRAENIKYMVDRTTFDINYMGQIYPITTKMVGMHNVYNIITAITAGLIIGLDMNQMITALETLIPPL